MTQEKFKLPRSSYDELCRIIKAYGRLNTQASLKEVNEISGIAETIISANNGFLSAVEIIEGGKTKIATDKGRQLARSLEHNLQKRIEVAWQTIIENNDFLKKMILAVGIRNGMEISSLESHIAYSAGQPKSKRTTTGVRCIIDILRSSGLVKEENDQIIPKESVHGRKAVPTLEGEPIPSVTRVPIAEASTSAGVNLNIEVHINVKPSELDGLGEKLKALIETLSNNGGPYLEELSENDELKG